MKEAASRMAISDQSDLKRNFFGGLWHGAFLALGNALTQPQTVLAGFISDLTGSTVWVGGLTTVLTVAQALPQIIAPRYIEPRTRKMPYLLAAIYLRVFSWGLLAWLIYTIGSKNPQMLAWTLVLVLAVFYAGGGFGGIPYTDIIGKVIPPLKRGTFFASRAALGGLLALAGAYPVGYILKHVSYPNDYALLFAMAAISLGIASVGFLIIHEPPRPDGGANLPTWREYWGHAKAVAVHLSDLVAVYILIGFGMMAMPFYVVFARKVLEAPTVVVAWFTALQILGGLLSNLLWARLVDRYGSKFMIQVLSVIAATAPLLAVLIGSMGWRWLYPSVFLAGASLSGQNVGFNSALLEISPPEERPTYAGISAIMSLPLAFLPLLTGWLLKSNRYSLVFLGTTVFILIGTLWTLRLSGLERR